MFASLAAKLSPNSLLTQSFPPAPTWSTKDLPDCTGKVILVTGGNQGIGYETVKVCLWHGAKVYMACRSATKAEQAIARLKLETGKTALFLPLDLADLRSVKQAAEEFIKREPSLDVLFLNAGILAPLREERTVQGYDLQFGVNVLAHAYLSKLLMPSLLHPHPSKPKPRIITTSSTAHVALAPKEGIVFDAIRMGKVRDRVGSMSRIYGMSKLGNVVWAQWLHQHYGEEIVSIAVHPGHITTNMVANAPFEVKSQLSVLPNHSPSMGALTQLWAGLSDECADKGGAYYIPWGREATGAMNRHALDQYTQERLAEFVESATRGI